MIILNDWAIRPFFMLEIIILIFSGKLGIIFNVIIDYKRVIERDDIVTEQIPAGGLTSQSITAVIKKSGRVSGYMLANGEILTKAETLRRAKEGGISNIMIAERDGSEYLRSIPDNSTENNLSSMPFFDD